jgi:K+-transporting ATPase c subunit
LVTWLLCGLAYPLALTGLGQWLMPSVAAIAVVATEVAAHGRRRRLRPP